MGNKTVTVVARARAKAGMEEIVKQELSALVAPTRSEPGCVNYDLHQGVEDRSLFVFYENWASQEDLQKHLGMPYIKAILERAGELLAEPPEITLFEKIA